jgi:predicted permease
MQTLLSDLQYALRSLRRAPVFTTAAVLTLGLGIGANVTIYSVVHAVLVRDLPFTDPDRLVAVGHQHAERGTIFGAYSPQDLDDLRAGSPGFSSLASYWYASGNAGRNMTGVGEPVQVQATMASGDLFPTLGVQALRGRTFGPDDDAPGRNQVMVASDRFWRTRLGGDPGAVGRTIRLDGAPYVLIGVMPPSFTFPTAEADVWLPLSLMKDNDVPHVRGVRWLDVVGRLAPGVTLPGITAQTSAVISRLEAAYPESNQGWSRSAIVPLREHLVGTVRPALQALLAAVGLVLLIACVNVAHLLLVRGAARAREIGVRAALGATRSRLVRQLLAESLVLGVAGGLLGMLVAAWGLPILVHMAGGVLPRAGEVRIDRAVLGFAVAASFVAFLCFGLIPALRTSRLALLTALRGDQPPARGPLPGLGALLLTAESAFAVLILSGTVLTLTSLWRLTHVQPGFDPDNVVSFKVQLQGEKYNASGVADRFRSDLLDGLSRLPGVVAAGGSKQFLLSGGGEPYTFDVAGLDGAHATVRPDAGYFMVTPGYFKALGIPLLRGREFAVADTAVPIPMIVNQALAKQAWPGDDALGQRITMGKYEGTIVGIVPDVHNLGLGKTATSTAYVPFPMFPRGAISVFVRVQGSPLAVLARIGEVVHQLDPDLPVTDLGPLRTQLQASVAQPRLFTLLLGLFGSAALVLAMIGVYGVAANAVSRRRREIGIRMALGARARQVVRLVLRQTLVWSLAGVVAGLVMFVGLARLLRGLLYGVNPTDPILLATGGLALFAAALLAAYLPARQAAAVDPVIVLRGE